MQFKKPLAESLIVLTLACGSAHAAPLQFEYSATVTYSDNSLQGVGVGSTFMGTFSYDPATPANYDLGNVADYGFGESSQITAIFQNHQATAGALHVDITNDFGGNVEDVVEIGGGYPLSVDGATYSHGSLGIYLMTQAGNTGVLTSTALPSSYDVGAFDGGAMTYGWMQRDGGQTGRILLFSINSIRVAAPEPATNVLLGLGLISALLVCRRKRD